MFRSQVILNGVKDEIILRQDLFPFGWETYSLQNMVIVAKGLGTVNIYFKYLALAVLCSSKVLEKMVSPSGVER